MTRLIPMQSTPSAQSASVAPDQPLLEVQGLSIDFVHGHEVVHAVRGVDFAIEPGEIVGLVGESGSGKSVTAMAILRLLSRGARLRGGTVRFEGLELLSTSESRLRTVRGARIAMVFQDPLSSLNPLMPIGRQIMEVLRTHLRMNKQLARDRTIELLDLVGIPAASRRLGAYPHEFSGGMRQRVMIAMALACRPSLLIADEPTTSLDVTVQAQIVELLERLREEFGMAVLLITHDIGLVAGSADRILVMYAGRLVEAGHTESILEAPRHPYTHGLLRSIPSVDDPRATELHVIAGAPPDPTTEFIGCAFEPRCAWATDTCRIDDPELESIGPGRFVACWVKPDARVQEPLHKAADQASEESA